MNDFLVILIATIIFVIIFFGSTRSHKVGYVIFLIWSIGIYGSQINTEKVNAFLYNHRIFNMLYKIFLILLLIFCGIGIIQAVVRIFSCGRDEKQVVKIETPPTTAKPEKFIYDGRQSEKNEKKDSISEEISPKETGILDKEDTFTYLMDRVYLFSQKKSFWDGSVTDNIEEKAYSILRDFIDNDYLILPHVSFREIFWWGEYKKDWRLTDRVTKMHFDFGIYNKDLQPILFIEIQGKSHTENLEVIERDKFKLEVMNRCGMKLIAIDCSESMTDSEIREKIIARVKKEIPDRKAYAAYCPNCKNHGKNSLMIIKRNKNGTYFYGCSTYEENKQDNCPGVSIEDVPPLYWGIPLFKVEKEK